MKKTCWNISQSLRALDFSPDGFRIEDGLKSWTTFEEDESVIDTIAAARREEQAEVLVSPEKSRERAGGAGVVEYFNLAGRVLDLAEGGGGCGWWQPPVAGHFQVGFTPFAWRTGVTCPRQVAGAEYLEAMVRPGNVYPPVAPSPFCQSRLDYYVASGSFFGLRTRT